MSAVDPDAIEEHASAWNFAETLAHIERAIVGAGLTIFARIDHDAGARDVGLSMPPATVLIYGNPKGGTPIMLAAPVTALDLPLRVLVQERTGGQTVVAFHPIAQILRAAGVADDVAQRLAPAQHLVVAALD